MESTSNICNNCGSESVYLRNDEYGCKICDECYSERYEQICPICEDYFNIPTCPEETFFILDCKDAEKLGMKGGIYNVLSWPYTVNCLISGFQHFIPGSVELINEFDINSITSQFYKHEKIVESGEICQDCVKLYSYKK